jgi:putative transposase
MKDNNWARLLAYVTGLINQELLLQNEYLIAENRILRSHIPKRLRLSEPQRATLAEIGKRLGRKLSATWRAWRNQTRFSPGTAN